jgi:hypothetical protein
VYFINILYSIIPITLLCFDSYNFYVVSIVMLDSTRKNTTDVFKLTCHCFILVVYLVQRPDDRLVN